MASFQPAHLDPSELGTREYWDAAYKTEITNHASDPSDTGHSWFSESDAEGRVSRFLETLSDEGTLSQSDTSFLDLGTGNGSMLFALRDDDWEGEMLGVDYSEASVELARRLEETRARGQLTEAEADDNADQGEEAKAISSNVRFEVWDLLGGNYRDNLWPLREEASVSKAKGWDVVLDKGTFDAISLSGDRDTQGRRIVEGYRDRIKPLVLRGTGLLVVTSCNWTEAELRKWFVTEGVEEADGGFEVFGRVKYPTFKFGGQEGQTISTLVFRRT